MMRRARRRHLPGLDALAAHWQLALDAAQHALDAAHGSLPDDELTRRAQALAAERQLTAAALARLAEAGAVDPPPWLSPVPLRHLLLGLPADTRACVFDLEGVLTDSSALHARAWGEVFDEFLRRFGERAGRFVVPFDREADYRSYVDGRTRLDGVQTFLRSRGIQVPLGLPDDPAEMNTVNGLARRKSEALTRRLDAEGVTALAGARRYLEAAGRLRLGRAVVSASVRAASMLELAGLDALVEERIDADRLVAEGLLLPPAPDVLLALGRRLDAEPHETVSFTASRLGVAAGRAAGVVVIGVGAGRRAAELADAGAERIVPSLTSLLDVRLATGL